MQFKASLVALVATLYMPQLITALQNTVDGAFIVEFNDGHKADNFYKALKSAGVEATPRKAWDHELYHGASFRLKGDASDATVAKILDMNEVKAIHPVRVYARPQAALPVPFVPSSPINVLDNEGRHLAKRVDEPFSTHVMGGVDKLQAKGITGKGINICIVDTGIDYNHPALGGGFGPKYKVKYGKDLVGMEYDGSNTPVPDDDPMDCAGHGTHVAGIIAGDPKDKYVRGVAPDVTLGIMKVFGCPKSKGGEAGSASNDVLIDAYLECVKHKPDIITASIGGASGWPEDPWAAVVQKITTQHKIPCTISNGNDGSEGVFYASGAADAYDAIGIGSIDNTKAPAVLTEATYGSGKTFGFTPATQPTFGDETFGLWFAPADNALACNPLAADTPDLKDKLVVISRGVCTFDTKVGNAVAKGAKNIMLVNNVPGTIAAAVTIKDVTVGMVPPEVGAAWKAAPDSKVTFKAKANVFVTISDNNITGGAMSGYTTWGPTNEAGIKPEVSTPGGNILSTYPLAKGGYAVLSGTSMACPYAAGVVALYMQKNGIKGGQVSPKVISAALANTADPVKFNDGTNKTYPLLAPVVQQGGGMVNAFNMVYGTLSSDTPVLSLNDTAHMKESYTITLYNKGQGGSFKLGHEGAATVYTTAADSSSATVFQGASGGPIPELSGDFASVNFGYGSTVNIRSGGSAKFTVKFKAPASALANAKRVPVFSGFITVTPTGGYGSSGKVALRIPYAGVAADMKKDIVLTDFQNGYPAMTDNTNNTVTAANHTVFTPSNPPEFNWRLVMGSYMVRVDIVAKDSKLNKVTTVGEKVIGPLFGFPSMFNPRNTSDGAAQVPWDGRVNGKKVPDGMYSILYRALKIFGNPNKNSDYERWQSDFFEIKGFN